jgi:hypothetical protein
MIRVAVVVLARRLTLRIYSGSDLIVEALLSRRRGLVLLADLADALLMSESTGEDAPAARA